MIKIHIVLLLKVRDTGTRAATGGSCRSGPKQKQSCCFFQKMTENWNKWSFYRCKTQSATTTATAQVPSSAAERPHISAFRHRQHHGSPRAARLIESGASRLPSSSLLYPPRGANVGPIIPHPPQNRSPFSPKRPSRLINLSVLLYQSCCGPDTTLKDLVSAQQERRSWIWNRSFKFASSHIKNRNLKLKRGQSHKKIKAWWSLLLPATETSAKMSRFTLQVCAHPFQINFTAERSTAKAWLWRGSAHRCMDDHSSRLPLRPFLSDPVMCRDGDIISSDWIRCLDAAAAK